ncbi:MAG: carbohydrate ABC transporter permease [Clostridiales bacterium]|nr:carbohydrate ABC transporter permease [Clostridiales bacterium]
MKNIKNQPKEAIRAIMLKRFLHILIYLFSFAVALTAFYPFLVMIVSSTHDTYNIVAKINILPGDQLVRNFNRLTQYINLRRGFLNSLFLAVVTSVVQIYFTAMAGYAFSKFKFKGQNFLFGVVLVAMMIPGQISIIGFYKQIQDMGLINNYIPIIIPAIADCFAVFFYKQFLDSGLPNELVEAAIADGAKEITIFHRLVIPIMKPALVTKGVMSFIGSWNSYLKPLILLNDKDKMTLPLMIATVRDSTHADFGAQYIGMVISVIPLVIIFIFSSRIIMNNISVGSAIKG